jgi:hypothetical protein
VEPPAPKNDVEMETAFEVSKNGNVSRPPVDSFKPEPAVETKPDLKVKGK